MRIERRPSICADAPPRGAMQLIVVATLYCQTAATHADFGFEFAEQAASEMLRPTASVLPEATAARISIGAPFGGSSPSLSSADLRMPTAAEIAADEKSLLEAVSASAASIARPRQRVDDGTFSTWYNLQESARTSSASASPYQAKFLAGHGSSEDRGKRCRGAGVNCPRGGGRQRGSRQPVGAALDQAESLGSSTSMKRSGRKGGGHHNGKSSEGAGSKKHKAKHGAGTSQPSKQEEAAAGAQNNSNSSSIKDFAAALPTASLRWELPWNVPRGILIFGALSWLARFFYCRHMCQTKESESKTRAKAEADCVESDQPKVSSRREDVDATAATGAAAAAAGSAAAATAEAAYAKPVTESLVKDPSTLPEQSSDDDASTHSQVPVAVATPANRGEQDSGQCGDYLPCHHYEDTTVPEDVSDGISSPRSPADAANWQTRHRHRERQEDDMDRSSQCSTQTGRGSHRHHKGMPLCAKLNNSMTSHLSITRSSYDDGADSDSSFHYSSSSRCTRCSHCSRSGFKNSSFPRQDSSDEDSSRCGSMCGSKRSGKGCGGNACPDNQDNASDNSAGRQLDITSKSTESRAVNGGCNQSAGNAVVAARPQNRWEAARLRRAQHAASSSSSSSSSSSITGNSSLSVSCPSICGSLADATTQSESRQECHGTLGMPTGTEDVGRDVTTSVNKTSGASWPGASQRKEVSIGSLPVLGGERHDVDNESLGGFSVDGESRIIEQLRRAHGCSFDSDSDHDA